MKASPPQKLVVDGELMGSTPVTFEVEPKALAVLVDLELDESHAD